MCVFFKLREFVFGLLFEGGLRWNDIGFFVSRIRRIKVVWMGGVVVIYFVYGIYLWMGLVIESMM